MTLKVGSRCDALVGCIYDLAGGGHSRGRSPWPGIHLALTSTLRLSWTSRASPRDAESLSFRRLKGEWVYGQMHMKSKQGTDFITQADSANYSPDYAQKDLYNAIERGEYPGWDVCWQIMTPKEAEELWEKQKINIFDLTHVWPQKQFPLRKVGEFFLNENVKNYFAEIEQIAFNPSHLPPGLEPSADAVLQSRLFSYPDTHRHRLGVNYQQLPVNSTRVPYRMANFQRDGNMAFYNQGSRPAYLSSIQPISFRNRTVDLDKTHGHFIGNATTFLSEIRPEDFNAPRALWEKVWDEGARSAQSRQNSS